jgi:hypothetical protein
MWRLKSMTTPVPTALPATEVPAPRAVMGTSRPRQTSMTAAPSSWSAGQTTAVEVTRYSDASEEYMARGGAVYLDVAHARSAQGSPESIRRRHSWHATDERAFSQHDRLLRDHIRRLRAMAGSRHRRR